MSITNIIIGLAVAVFVGWLIIAWHRDYRNFVAISLALGVAAAGVIVTVFRVQQYNEDKAVVESAASPSQSGMGYGSSAPPVAVQPAPIIVPAAPLMRGPAGAAAPAAAKNPYLDAGK